MVISILEEGPYNQIIYQVILFEFAEFQEMSAEETSTLNSFIKLYNIFDSCISFIMPKKVSFCSDLQFLLK